MIEQFTTVKTFKISTVVVVCTRLVSPFPVGGPKGQIEDDRQWPSLPAPGR